MEANCQKGKGFVSFDQFLEQTRAARFEDYQNAPGARVADKAAFEQMKAHLVSLYQGVTVRHSFLDAAGHCIDCVPIEQQPALRHSPPSSFACTVPSAMPTTPAPQDRFGHEMSCSAGTFPMRRIGLEELTRFTRLEDFLGK